MTKKKVEMKIITAGFIMSWIFGILFAFLGLALFITKSYITASLTLIGSIVLMPYFSKILERKFAFKMTFLIKGIITIILLVFFIIGINGDNNESENKQNSTTSFIKSSITEKTTSTSQTKVQKPLELSYDDMYRNEEKWIGKPVYITGEIVQVLVDETDQTLRVALNGDWEDIVLANYVGAERLREGDQVEIVGEYIGLITYESLFGQSITVPGISVTELSRLKLQSSTVVKPSGKSYSETLNGVTIIVDDYTFVKSTEEYGKLQDLTFILENKQGSETIYPSLLVMVSDKENSRFTIAKEITLSELIENGESIKKTISVDLGVGSLLNPKELKVTVMEFGKPIVLVDFPVDFKTNPSLG